jgi:NTP pyrophosphatase (non-canonical NTP hydrolase)
MDPIDPLDAQQVVFEYARLLERDIAENRHPARIESLPFAKPIIKTAIRTSVTQLARSGQLTEELRDYLETAYISLAEYLDAELVNLMTEYRRSAEQLTAEPASAHDKTSTPAWRTLVESGRLAGEVARATTSETETLRSEFQEFLASA